MLLATPDDWRNASRSNGAVVDVDTGKYAYG
jgi:hypothetical protein